MSKHDNELPFCRGEQKKKKGKKYRPTLLFHLTSSRVFIHLCNNSNALFNLKSSFDKLDKWNREMCFSFHLVIPPTVTCMFEFGFATSSSMAKWATKKKNLSAQKFTWVRTEQMECYEIRSDSNLIDFYATIAVIDLHLGPWKVIHWLKKKRRMPSHAFVHRYLMGRFISCAGIFAPSDCRYKFERN